MELAALFDDFPLVNIGYGHPHRSRPLPLNLLVSLEDQMDQRVGQIFRHLPAFLSDLDDAYAYQGGGVKCKLKSNALSLHEPKPNVMVTAKDNKFQVSLDTSNYQPKEISVKVVNNKIAVSAKHECKGHGVYEYSKMYRSFDLPDDIDPNAITSRLSADGQLMVEAPLKPKETLSERTIPVAIQRNEQQAVENSKTPMMEQS